MFHKPVYVRINKADKTSTPGYMFNAQPALQGITVIVSKDNTTEIDIVKEALVEEKDWWFNCLNGFLAVANTFFTKTYATDVLSKHIKHTDINTTDKLPIGAVVVATPKYILLAEATFTMGWIIEKTNKIDVPDLESPATAVDVSSGLDELDADSLPSGEPAEFAAAGIAAGGAGSKTEAEASNTVQQSRHIDKRKIHEAKLRVKLAHYKAEKAVSRYLEKYGDDDISDSGSESTEWETDASSD